MAPGFDRGLAFEGDETEEMQPRDAASVLNIEDVMTSTDTFDFLQVKPIEREPAKEKVIEEVLHILMSLCIQCC